MRGLEYVEIQINQEIFDLLPIQDRRAINDLKRKVLWRYMSKQTPAEETQSYNNLTGGLDFAGSSV